MTAFVVRCQFFLLIAHDMGFSLRPRHDALDGFLQCIHVDGFPVAARGQKCRFVDQVGKVCSGEARRTPREDIEVGVLIHRLAFRMHFQDCETTPHVRLVNDNLPVKAPRTQKRGIENIGAVRRCDDDNALVRRKAVHFHKKLIERLLTFVVSAADARAALATHCVNLINEHDARRVSFRLVEQIAHSRSADTDEHLNEIRTADAEKRHAGLARHRPRKKRLARARRAEKKHAFRDARTQVIEFFRLAQELNDFFQFLLGLVRSGDVAEVHFDLVPAAHARVAAAERHHASAAALGLLHDEKPNARQQENRQYRRQHRRPPRRLWRVLCPNLHIFVLQTFH